MDFRKSSHGRPIETEYTDTCSNHSQSDTIADEVLEALETDLEFAKLRPKGKCSDCRNWTEQGKLGVGCCAFTLRRPCGGSGCSLLYFPRNQTETA